MSNANLLQALKNKHSNKTIENVVLYGKVRCLIETPDFVKDLKTSEGYYALLDTLAFRCLGTDYFCDSDGCSPNGLYFTKGSILIFLKDTEYIDKFIKVYSTSGTRGCKIRRQFGAESYCEGISALAFKRDNVTDSFIVSNNTVTELKSTDSFIKGTHIETMIEKGMIDSRDYPDSLSTIQTYAGLLHYKQLDLDKIQEVIPKVTYTKPTQRINVSNMQLNLVHRLECKPLSVNYDLFKQECKDMSKARSEHVKSMLDYMKGYYELDKKHENYFRKVNGKLTIDYMFLDSIAPDIKHRFKVNIVDKMQDFIPETKISSKTIVERVLEFARNHSIFDTDVEREVLKNTSRTIDSLQQALEMYPDDMFEAQNIPLLDDDVEFAIGLICVITGISFEDIQTAFNFCPVDKDMFFYLLIHVPVLLSIITPTISLVQSDRIYHSFKLYYSMSLFLKEIREWREDYTFCLSLAKAQVNDSLLSIKGSKNLKSYYPKKDAENYVNYGYPDTIDNINIMQQVLRVRVSFGKGKIGMSSLTGKFFSEYELNGLIEKGMLDTIGDDVIITSDMEKEFLIYDTLQTFGTQETEVDNELIADTIEWFEEDRGFSLEPLQKDAIQLTKFRAGVLSGCAGSGKTTTSDCMVEVLKRLPNFYSKYELVFCTPTGMACRRLAEVIKGTVRTIHSQFNLNQVGTSFMSKIGKAYNPDNSDESIERKSHIYIMDEMAMCSMDLLYRVCRCLTEDDIIYFLGDVKQLPPIDRGNPFAVLMKFLPCVELGVSKRAAEGSGVSYNANLINNMSDGYLVDLEYNDSDFKGIECTDTDIIPNVVKAWKENMQEGYLEDDIQVISGYRTNRISFSTSHLNSPLQKLLRFKDRIAFRYNNREFYVNDRIIHLNKNDYNILRYEFLGDDTYQELATTGMVNGEVGKIVGIIRSDLIRIVEFDSKLAFAGKDIYENVDEKTLNIICSKRAKRLDKLREDRIECNPSIYFIIVSVYDAELSKDVIVLLRATMMGIIDSIIDLRGADLADLDLAYALPCHKMQGSQNKVIIAPFGTQCNPTFINRNMINTIITRSQEKVVLVGSLDGVDSPINMGRRKISPIDCNDVLSLLANT